MKLKTPEGENLLCWAEFVKADDPKAINVGDSISLAEAEERSRSKEEPLKPWIRGVFSQKQHGVSVYEFNREKRGWHYGWASNKHTCNASHCLVAWVFERSRLDPEKLICRGIIESPQFMLFCRRRRRFTLVPSAPIAEPRKSKSSKDFDEEDEDDDFDDEDDDEEEEEEEVPKSKSKKKKASPLVGGSSSSSSAAKKAKLERPGAVGANGARPHSSGSSLDKIRTDALLSLLHVAWRKMKDTELHAANEHAGSGAGIGDMDLPGILDFRQEGSSSAHAETQPLANTADMEFLHMLEFFSGDLDFDPLHFDQSTSPPTSPENAGQGVSVEDMDEHEVDPDIEALARYLLEEPDFRQSVQWLRGQGAHPDFSAFISILRDHIQKFMKLRFWTAADVERLIHSTQGGEARARMEREGEEFSWAAEQASPGTPRHFDVSGARIPNITGVWKQTRESQIAMEQFRESTGSSWVMSKLFEFMESKFSIQQNANELSCRLWPMPALKFVLDAQEHPWGIRLPLFQPNWTYRAWTDGEAITLQHQIENRRLTRMYWCDPYRKYLYSEATLEVWDDSVGKFVKESRVRQSAERVA